MSEAEREGERDGERGAEWQESEGRRGEKKKRR